MLRAIGIWKSFPGVQALEDVRFELYPGEVVALIGENGAGKSTLGKVLAGVHQQDRGEIVLDGKAVDLSDVKQAMSLGIALIHQELNLLDNLNVAENIFLGHEPRWPLGLFNRAKAKEEAAVLLERVGLKISPSMALKKLTIGQQQLVEVAKALSHRARIIVMDEPTSSLSRSETDNLIQVIRQLRDDGVGVVFVSHRLGEVRQVADRVVVLRDGRNAGELSKEECTHANMVKLMVGRDLSQFYQKTASHPGQVVFEVKGLVTKKAPKTSVSFCLRQGEILGLGGLVGAGRTEVAETLFGIQPRLGGEILLHGRPIDTGSPSKAIQAGIGLVPEDRKETGLILEMALRDNITLAALRKIDGSIFLRRKKENAAAEGMAEDLKIKRRNMTQPATLLSGGNQQKAVLAKWLLVEPKILILDEPTRGIDVGAKQDIYGLMSALAAKGTSIVMISSEMEELLAMSDRVLVMKDGAVAGELQKHELSEEAVVSLATKGSEAA